MTRLLTFLLGAIALAHLGSAISLEARYASADAKRCAALGSDVCIVEVRP